MHHYGQLSVTHVFGFNWKIFNPLSISLQLHAEKIMNSKSLTLFILTLRPISSVGKRLC